MVLTLSNVYKFFNNGSSPFVLNIPSISLESGKLTFVMGHNGSGKSVFCKIISGYIDNDRDLGISMDRREIPLSDFFSRVKMIHQKISDNLALDLTVKENLIINSCPQRFIDKLLPFLSLNETILQYCKTIPFLHEKANQPVKELSGGQQQTLAFYTLLFTEPSLLLLDEFLSATDYSITSKLLAQAQKIAHKAHTIVLIISHDVDTALQYGDEIMIFRDGKIEQIISKDGSNWNADYIKAQINKSY